MKRREFITVLGGAVTWPLAARAQQPAIPIIGYLDSRSPEAVENRLRGFRQGLKDAGYHLGRINADQRAERCQGRCVFVYLNKHNTTNSVTQTTCGFLIPDPTRRTCRLIYILKDDLILKNSVNQTERSER